MGTYLLIVFLDLLKIRIGASATNGRHVEVVLGHLHELLVPRVVLVQWRRALHLHGFLSLASRFLDNAVHSHVAR